MEIQQNLGDRLHRLKKRRMDQPTGHPQGQRMLAAIVFTDVVGFSTLAGIDEAKALRLLERDAALIKSICDQHGAIVVKGTGDGMLVCFISAVEAVQAALQIQEGLRKQSETLPTQEALKHRIGVHLGDVVVMAGDVIGDGVNIAARLQSEAKPGGIAVSDAVYSVVRGKVNFKAMNLGPRNLKHIVETVNVWMIPPADEPLPASKPVHPASNPAIVLDPTRDSSPSGGRLVAVLVGIAVCLGLLAFVGMQLLNASRTTTASNTSTPALKPAPTQDSSAPPTEQPSAPAPSSTAGQPSVSEPSSPAGATPSAQEPAADDEASKLTSNFEFDAAADYLERQPNSDRFTARVARLRRMGELRRWMETGLAAATKANPVRVMGGGGSGDRDYQVWTDSGALRVLLADGSERGVTLRDFEPRELLRITAAILQKENASSNERQNILQRARDFALEMRLGQMPSTLE